MEKEVLSLKSIYKFLTINDYPVYSGGIIRKDNKSGLTLTRFCHENIIVDFKNRKTGKIIWRTQGGRNRYVSEICNRSKRLNFYREYAGEIIESADRDVVLRQIRQFMYFLKARDFSYEIFSRKLPAYIDMFADSDEAFSVEAQKFFDEALAQKAEIEKCQEVMEAFVSGWFLTFLMFHALMGNGEGESFLQKIRADESLSLKNMYLYLSEDGTVEKEQVIYLTGTNTELNSSPLGVGHFFGREEELFELREMLAHGGRYLISGIGGVGKTELMRQFLKCCVVERLVDYICVVQYEGGLAKSLVKAFPQIQGTDLGQNYREVLARIREHAGKKILLAIDNVDGDIEEEEMDVLRKLPVTIFMTSRYQKIKGFKTYHLKSIGRESGKLIFRDNYGSSLNEEERKILDKIVDREVWCHTLTLRLLAKTAKNCGWSLEKLREQMEKHRIPVGVSEPGQYENLKQVYSGMYVFAGLSPKLKQFLRVFSTFPYQSYNLALIEKYMNNLLDENVEESLDKLWAGGWLERQGASFSMHPFIAECILSTPIVEEECAPFFENIIAEWKSAYGSLLVEYFPDMIYRWDKVNKETDRSLMEITRLTKVFVNKLSGGVREEFLQIFLLAAVIEYNYFGASKSGLVVAEKLYKRKKKLSQEAQIYADIILCYYGYENHIEVLWDEWADMKKNTNVEERYKFIFADVLSVRLYNMGQFAKAEELTEYILEHCRDDNIRLSGYGIYSSLMIQKGDFAAHGEWLQKGIELGQRIGKEKSSNMQQLLMNMCSLKIALGKYDEAEAVLQQLEESNIGNMYYMNCHIEFYRGSLAMHRGDEGFGVDHLEKAWEYARNLYSGIEDRNYSVSLVELAMAYNKAGKYDNAEACYREALTIYSDMEENVFDRHRILNNMSVMYLDWGRPEEAKKYLIEGLALAENMGGLALGENLNNLSKACRAVGDNGSEREYLERAIPILEQFYGSEHPKVKDAKERLFR